MQVADGVAGLHGGDDRQLVEVVIVGGPDDLGVLDAPARVGQLPLRFRHGAQGLLVPGGDLVVALVADGVGGDLDAGAQRLLIKRHDLVVRGAHQAVGVGPVGIGLEQHGPARAQGAVGVELDRPGDDPSVRRLARAARHQGAGVAHVDAVVDPNRRLAVLRHLFQQGHVLPRRAHEVDAGPAIAGIDVEARAIGRARRRCIGLGRQTRDQVARGVDQQTRRLAVRAFQDIAARGGRRRSVDPGGGHGGA
ncbi:hypothetical protein D3C80_939020 [compost metagenome]